MGSTLAAIGRAQPSRTIANVLQSKLAVEQGERREALTQSSLAVDRERLLQMKNQREYQQKQIEQMEQWLPVDSLLEQFEGGPESPMAQFALKKAKAMGFVNEEMGGIQRQHAIAMGKELSKPENVSTLSRLRLQHYTNAKDQAKAALMEKPDDEKLKQAYIEANSAYQAAFALDPQVQKQVEAQKKDKLERDKIAAANERDRAKTEAANERARLDRISREKISKNKSDKDKGPEGYKESLSRLFTAIGEEGKDPKKSFLEMRKTFPSKAKELIAFEKGLKEIADLPEDLQQALEVNAIAINNGELDAEEVSRKLGADWPEYSTMINRILIKRRQPEDLAEALKTIFQD